MDELEITAKLLSRSSGVEVKIGNYPAPMTNKGIICLPIEMVESLEIDLIVGSLIHEAAHVKHTDMNTAIKHEQSFDMLNLAEDCRIDHISFSEYGNAKNITISEMRFLLQNYQWDEHLWQDLVMASTAKLYGLHDDVPETWAKGIVNSDKRITQLLQMSVDCPSTGRILKRRIPQILKAIFAFHTSQKAKEDELPLPSEPQRPGHEEFSPAGLNQPPDRFGDYIPENAESLIDDAMSVMDRIGDASEAYTEASSAVTKLEKMTSEKSKAEAQKNLDRDNAVRDEKRIREKLEATANRGRSKKVRDDAKKDLAEFEKVAKAHRDELEEKEKRLKALSDMLREQRRKAYDEHNSIENALESLNSKIEALADFNIHGGVGAGTCPMSLQNLHKVSKKLPKIRSFNQEETDNLDTLVKKLSDIVIETDMSGDINLEHLTDVPLNDTDRLFEGSEKYRRFKTKVAYVLDRSSSMDESLSREDSIEKIEAVRHIAKTVIKRIEDLADNAMGDNFQDAIYIYNNYCERVKDYGEKADIEKCLHPRNYVAFGGTSAYAAVKKAEDDLEEYHKDRKIIFLFTDSSLMEPDYKAIVNETEPSIQKIIITVGRIDLSNIPAAVRKSYSYKIDRMSRASYVLAKAIRDAYDEIL